MITILRTSKALAVIQAVLLAILVLTSSVAMPILVRPFYHAHVEYYQLDDYVGLPAEAIYEAYDEVMDYTIGLSDTFSAGVFAFSEEGEAHFADVKVLFLLVLGAMVMSAVGLIISYCYGRKKRLGTYRFRGHTAGFWAAVGLVGTIVVLGIAIAIDFDRAFVVFHTIFFPGQSNWIFDDQIDPIILVLPQEFFRNCAILIGGLMILWCTALIGGDIVVRNKKD